MKDDLVRLLVHWYQPVHLQHRTMKVFVIRPMGWFSANTQLIDSLQPYGA